MEGREIKHKMRRMLLPEVKIKSKVKDNVSYISIEELLTHGYINNARCTRHQKFN